MPMKKTRQAPQRNVVGSRIRAARLKCNPPVSQDDLAGRLASKGITLDQTASSRIEKQTRYLIDYELIAIAKALNANVASLVGEK